MSDGGEDGGVEPEVDPERMKTFYKFLMVEITRWQTGMYGSKVCR